MIRRRSLVLAILAIVLLLAIPSLAGFYTDWLWFQEVGYVQVFIRTFTTENTLFLATALVVFATLFLNFRFARRAVASPRMQPRALSSWATPAAAVVAILMGLTATGNWLAWLSYFHQVPFSSVDPIFHRDVSFYVFALPVYQSLQDQLLAVAWLTLIGSGLIYILSGSFVLEARYGMAFWPKVRLIPSARLHLGLLAAFLFLMLAWGAWLDRFGLLFSTSTVVFGAGYTDLYARLPFLNASMVALMVGAALAVAYGLSRRGWLLPLAVIASLVVTVVGWSYAGIIESFVVSPNEQDKQQPYILNNIAATRKAYAIDHIEERDFAGDAPLSTPDIARNVDTLDNVRLWDHQPLLQTFSQIQEMRTYYEFFHVDNDRYRIQGKYRQVMLSVRELNTEHLQTRSWLNEHLSYTHGYGLTLGPVNQVTTGGLPVLYVQNIPPVSSVGLAVEEPSIYFGELSANYALVDTRTPEFHYPRSGTSGSGGSDSEIETTTYRGKGGVPIGNFLRRLAFALKFQTTDILVTKQITRESRILFNRQIGPRVQQIAPFLTLDADPYPVLSAGRIYWIQDAYTSTANYPYSSMTHATNGDLNYIRNSVKAVVDAYDGTTTFYLADPTDPLALTLANVFPGLLHPMGEMPAGLRLHVRYPEDIFKIQAQAYALFHMTNAQVFYKKEDQWEVPTFEGGVTATHMQPYYTLMKLPDERQAEFIQMLPFTPKAKPNLSAWLAARSDGEHYGHLIVFKFPKQKTVYGPQQIIGFINQDQFISPQITLWDQQGSKVVWGTLLVIPIEQSLIYVRPLYLQSAEGRIPELKRVVVAYQNQIVMAETLRQSLIQIFGRDVAKVLPLDRLENSATSIMQPSTTVNEPSADEGTPLTLSELAAEAQLHMDRSDKALKELDWTTFGEEQKKLRETLAKMGKIKR